jgi:hypothetical protein
MNLSCQLALCTTMIIFKIKFYSYRAPSSSWLVPKRAAFVFFLQAAVASCLVLRVLAPPSLPRHVFVSPHVCCKKINTNDNTSGSEQIPGVAILSFSWTTAFTTSNVRNIRWFNPLVHIHQEEKIAAKHRSRERAIWYILYSLKS